MRERSKVIGLMAKREAANLAKAQRTFSTLSGELRAAEALEQRLGFLLTQKCAESSGSTSVAQLREHRRLTDRLAAEGERLRHKVSELRAESRSAGSMLTQLEHRKRSYDSAAEDARRIEETAREARTEETVRFHPKR